MRERTEVLTPTQARQASPRRMNLRVLVTSMVLLVAVAAILFYAIYGYPDSAIGVPEQPTGTSEPAAPTAPPAH